MKKNKTIKVHTDPKSGDGFLMLEDLKDLVDISKVKKYSLEEVKTKGQPVGLILKFFDENGNQIK